MSSRTTSCRTRSPGCSPRRRTAATPGTARGRPPHLRRPATAAPIETAAAYLRQAVLNAERSARRSAVRRRAIDPILAAEEASTPVDPSDLALLDALDPDDRALLYLTAVERWTFAEVGVLFDKPEASLRRNTRRRGSSRHRLSRFPERSVPRNSPPGTIGAGNSPPGAFAASGPRKARPEPA